MDDDIHDYAIESDDGEEVPLGPSSPQRRRRPASPATSTAGWLDKKPQRQEVERASKAQTTTEEIWEALLHRKRFGPPARGSKTNDITLVRPPLNPAAAGYEPKLARGDNKNMVTLRSVMSGEDVRTTVS